jgi:hypothetical protein
VGLPPDAPHGSSRRPAHRRQRRGTATTKRRDRGIAVPSQALSPRCKATVPSCRTGHEAACATLRSCHCGRAPRSCEPEQRPGKPGPRCRVAGCGDHVLGRPMSAASRRRSWSGSSGPSGQRPAWPG